MWGNNFSFQIKMATEAIDQNITDSYKLDGNASPGAYSAEDEMNRSHEMDQNIVAAHDSMSDD